MIVSQYELSASNIMMMKLFWKCIITNNDVTAFTVNCHLYMKMLSAFLYGYLYSDTLTSVISCTLHMQ